MNPAESAGVHPKQWGGRYFPCPPELAEDFKSILFSYLDPGGNYIEQEILQRGVLWGIGTYLKAAPSDLEDKTKTQLYEQFTRLIR